jgi:polyisoprenoid-binding protein YceI
MKSKAIQLALTIALGLIFARSTEAEDVYKIDPAASAIDFRVKHFLGTAKGKFTQFSGTLDFDREHPASSNVTATIQVRSIDTAIAKRDEHLRGADFFNVAKYPEITFRSRGVKQTGSDTGDIVGELAMHGVKKEITLHVKFLGLKGAGAAQRSRWHVTAEPIKRSEFGLVFSQTAESVSMIGDTVTATMEIEAVKAK